MNAVRVTQMAVSVCGQAPPRAAIELAMEMARMFGAHMSALMIEDGSADSLGSIPFAREYVPGRALWREIGSADIEQRRETARRQARQIFGEIAGAQGLQTGFDVWRGGPQDELAHAMAAYDIVAIAAPERAADWMTLPFSALADAVLHGRATAIVLPSRVQRPRGPVAVLAAPGDDEAVKLGANIAKASGESLVVLAAGFADVAKASQAFVVVESVRLRIIDVDDAGLEGIQQLLADIGERALVIGRAVLPRPGMDRLIKLAAGRGSPVLVPGEPQPD